jgi:hypothetical protein
MSYVTFHDVSYANGKYNMDTDPSPVVEMKMSGFYYGSKQPYLDTQASTNYGNAIRTGKIPILYHYAGGADPVVEANYFINVACAPLAVGDIYELDYELTSVMNPPADPAAWCDAFVEQVKTLTGKYPLFYVNTSMLLQYGFQSVLSKCGLIIADYRYTPDQDIPGVPPYIIHQYTDSPLDTNALFIPLDTLRLYGHSVSTPVAPAPVELPVVTPVPVATPSPQPEPTPPVIVIPTPAPTVLTPPQVTPDTPIVVLPTPAPVTPPVTVKVPQNAPATRTIGFFAFLRRLIKELFNI